MTPRPRPRYAGVLDSEVRKFFALEFEDPGDDDEVPAVDLHRDEPLGPWWRRAPKLAIAVAATFMAVPAVVADQMPSSSAGDEAEVRMEAQSAAPAAAVRVRPTRSTEAPTTTSTVAPSTTTTEAPTTTTSTTEAPTTTTTEAPTTTTTEAPTTTTTEAPVPVVAAAPAPTTTTTVAPTTTTTEAPTTTTTTEAPEPQPTSQESGQASWYSQPSGYDARGCAHRTLPFGTLVTVSTSNRSTTCTVNDRGPYGAGRVIDLDDDVYAELAPLSTGVIDVVISW